MITAQNNKSMMHNKVVLDAVSEYISRARDAKTAISPHFSFFPRIQR